MVTVGVDLAAEPKRTALAVIEWAATSARVTAVELGVTDETIIGYSSRADKVGVECLRRPIAHATLRWVAIMAALESHGVDCSRDGSGRIAEVYPAAALKLWGLPHRGYKTGVESRQGGAVLVDRLLEVTPWLQWGDFAEACRESDDTLDAVAAALVARAVAIGATAPPESSAPADSEGWIHLPTANLQRLGIETG